MEVEENEADVLQSSSKECPVCQPLYTSMALFIFLSAMWILVHRLISFARPSWKAANVTTDVIQAYLQNLVSVLSIGLPEEFLLFMQICLFCSQEIMDEANPPLALPNGQVYSVRILMPTNSYSHRVTFGLTSVSSRPKRWSVWQHRTTTRSSVQ